MIAFPKTKALALAGGLALLSAGCMGNKAETPEVASDLEGTATGGGMVPPSAGTTSGPDGTSAGTKPTGPSTSGTPYGDGNPGAPPPATTPDPKPFDLAPKPAAKP